MDPLATDRNKTSTKGKNNQPNYKMIKRRKLLTQNPGGGLVRKPCSLPRMISRADLNRLRLFGVNTFVSRLRLTSWINIISSDVRPVGDRFVVVFGFAIHSRESNLLEHLMPVFPLIDITMI